MTDPDDITEDRGLKALFTTYPLETIEVFAPDLLAERGQPVSVDSLPQEVQLPDLGVPSRFLDVALKATWADGSTAVIVLIEHWSEVRKVNLRRVLWYVAALAVQHEGSIVVPVVLVTEATEREVPSRLTWTVGTRAVLDFAVDTVRVTPADIPRFRLLQRQNHVASMLLALAIGDAIDAVWSVMAAWVALGTPPDEIRRFLPLAMKLAKMTDDDQPRFHARMREDATMTTIFDEVEAKGEARATVTVLRDLVSKGILSVDAAKDEVRSLIASGALPEAVGQEAITRLG